LKLEDIYPKKKQGGAGTPCRIPKLIMSLLRWPGKQKTGKGDIPSPVDPAPCFELPLQSIKNRPV
jgi:hypothetical protein